MSPAARIAVLVVGALLVGLGLVLLPGGGGLAPLILGLLVLLSLVFEGRYRASDRDRAPADGGWEATAETFRDEESGQWVRVWFNPGTGERRYVAGESPPA